MYEALLEWLIAQSKKANSDRATKAVNVHLEGYYQGQEHAFDLAIQHIESGQAETQQLRIRSNGI